MLLGPGATRSVAQLPAEAGQTFAVHDISPWVRQAGPGSQKYIVDWVLQETGYAAWHGAVPGHPTWGFPCDMVSGIANPAQ